MLKNLKVSIFFKLIITVIIALVVLDIGILTVLDYVNETKPRKIFPHYVRRMERMLVSDIGFPPDTIKAKNVAEDLEMNIRFQSDKYNWATSPEVPTYEELLASPEYKERENRRPGKETGKPPEINNGENDDQFYIPAVPGEREHFTLKFQGSRYSVNKSPEGIYILQQPLPIDIFNPQLMVFLLICVVSVIIILLYIILRWIFKPLKKLSAAVNDISGGNYDINVPINRKDELGELAGSLNDMAASIKRSIKSKEQLLIDVSHELRSPLTRIKLGLEVGSSKEKIDEDVREMENMVTSLLENYRVESEYSKPRIEKIDLPLLIKEVIGEFNGNERIWFNIPDKENVFINTDYEKLKPVLRNIIDNALKYSAEKVEINISEQKDTLMIAVADKGSGIPEENLKYIFEPFYRSDPSRSRRTGGFGLGLSICKKIMDSLGGKIEIKSKINEGTEVLMFLPK
jgi:signal transduction histidine kinase